MNVYYLRVPSWSFSECLWSSTLGQYCSFGKSCQLIRCCYPLNHNKDSRSFSIFFKFEQSKLSLQFEKWTYTEILTPKLYSCKLCINILISLYKLNVGICLFNHPCLHCVFNHVHNRPSLYFLYIYSHWTRNRFRQFTIPVSESKVKPDP